MNRVNITFTPHTVAKASEMNEVVAKVNELVEGKLDTSHNTSPTAHQDLFAQTVRTSGNQTIAGTKSFTGDIVIPNKYVENGGNVLYLDSQNTVTTDYMPYLRFVGNRATYADLPSSQAVRVGDVYHIDDEGTNYYARSISKNNILTVIIDSASNPSTRLSVTQIDVSQYTPITTDALGSLVSAVTWTGNFPNVPSSGISDNQAVLNYTLRFYGSRVCFIPVTVNNYGTVIVMCGYERPNPRPVWALGGGDTLVNIWQNHVIGQGEIIDVSNGFTQTIISSGNLQTFQPLGGSVTWEPMGGVSSETDPVFNQWLQGYEDDEAIAYETLVNVLT